MAPSDHRATERPLTRRPLLVSRKPAQASRLEKALLVVVPCPVFVPPLGLVGLGLRELLLHLGSVFRGFARGMLGGDRSPTCRHERNGQQRYEDQGEDEPR